LRIVENPVLTDPENFSHLPVNNWRTLEEFARRADGGADLQVLINEGKVHREILRREVLALRGAVRTRRAISLVPDDLEIHLRHSGKPASDGHRLGLSRRTSLKEVEDAIEKVVHLAKTAGVSDAVIASALRQAADRLDGEEEVVEQEASSLEGADAEE
jgi:hypothetical protein